MRLKAFRVQMYKSFLDSTWIEVDDVTTIVGKNESGKTALLKALHKFNPFNAEPYRIDREWPRGHRQSQSPQAVVVQTRFDFDKQELDDIANLLPGRPIPEGVEISKTYEGEYTYKFLPEDLEDNQQVTQGILALLNEPGPGEHVYAEFKEWLAQAQGKVIAPHANMLDLDALKGHIEDFRNHVKSGLTSHELDKNRAEFTDNTLDKIGRLVDTAIVRLKVEQVVFECIPTFIYMDEQKPFQGIAQLDQIKGRKDNNQLTAEDRTFLMILELSGLDFEMEYQRATETEKEQRMLDMKDASNTLTNLLADHFRSQRRYEFKLDADGYYVIAFVSDEIQSGLIPLEERSKGFQWFFSFNATFLYETHGTFRNAVILLDEPGLHLHGAGQRDLLNRLKEYAESNQLIYTTHIPFMINMERLDNIRGCKEDRDMGTIVSGDLYSADEPTWLPLQVLLGWSGSQSLFFGLYNLVVEGPTDLWVITAMAGILRSEERTSLDDRIVITPAQSAAKAPNIAVMLQSQKLNVVVLLDSDSEGRNAADVLIKKLAVKDRQVLLLGTVIGSEEETVLEDLFPDDFYLHYVNEAYRKELKGKTLTLAEVQESNHPQLVRRIDAAFTKRGIRANSEGWAFNKGRVGKILSAELPKRSLSDLPPEMVERFEKLFSAINEAMPGT